MKVTTRVRISKAKEQLLNISFFLDELAREEERPENNLVLYKCSLMARLIELELEGIVKGD